MNFNAQTDPLGIGVQARGRAHRQAYEMQNLGHNMGPLSSSMWDGFFQAMQEQGVRGVADNSVGVARGMFGATPQTSTYDPSFQSSALQGLDQVTGVKRPAPKQKRGR